MSEREERKQFERMLSGRFDMQREAGRPESYWSGPTYHAHAGWQARAHIAEQEKAELLDFIRRVLDAGAWYPHALEIDMYKPDAADGEELEAEGRALLAKHERQ